MNKTFITILTALMLVFSSTLVLAASGTSVSWTTPTANLYQDQSRVIVANITNNGTVTESVTATMNLSALGITSVDTIVSASLAPGVSVPLSITLNTSDDTNVGPYTITLSVYSQNTSLATDNSTTTSSQTFSVLYPFCEDVTTMTSSPLRLYDIKNRADVDGEDFSPLDDFQVKVKVRNNDDEDSQDAVAEMILVQGNSEVDDTSVDLEAEVDEEDYYTFTLDGIIPADIDEGTAYLYVRVYNDDDEDNCDMEVLELNIEKKSQELSPTEVEFPKEVTCGETFTFSGRIANIGNSDEDKINVALSLFSQTFEQEFENFDSGDLSDLFSFDVTVPSNATMGAKKFTLITEYDYDDDKERFKDSTSNSYTLTVKDCKVELAKFTTETSTALIGTESEVRFLLTNPSSSTQTYTVSATADWATVSSVTPSTVTLEAGKQQYVSVKVTPNEDVMVGTHSVSAKISYGSTTESLSLPVNVQKASSSLGLFDKLSYQFKYNTMWVVTDVILVIAIIVLLVLIFAGKKK